MRNLFAASADRDCLTQRTNGLMYQGGTSQAPAARPASKKRPHEYKYRQETPEQKAKRQQKQAEFQASEGPRLRKWLALLDLVLTETLEERYQRARDLRDASLLAVAGADADEDGHLDAEARALAYAKGRRP